MEQQEIIERSPICDSYACIDRGKYEACFDTKYECPRSER